MKKRWAITDIHGCADTFQALLGQLKLKKGDELFLLGDYIDRGPDSKGVIDQLFDLREAGIHLICLRGNHEQLALDAREGDPDLLRMWMMNGGEQCLDSFGVDNPRDFPGKYLDFLENLPFFAKTDGYLLVHAGLNFRLSDPLGDHQSLLWIRDWYQDIDREWLEGRIILHGHTPRPSEEILEMLDRLEENRFLDLDAGCSHLRPGMGKLAAFDLDARSISFQERLEY